MTLLHAYLLYSLHKINGERTVYSVYHLLAGKKSSQTIQDAHLYGLAFLFKTLPGIKRTQFNELVEELHNKNYIQTSSSASHCTVTEKGVSEYMSYLQEGHLRDLDGYKYQDLAIVFWERLNLLVQVLSHRNHSVSRYYPITRNLDTQEWLKRYVRQTRNYDQNLSSQLFLELKNIFSDEFPESPNLLVSRLSGWKMIGLTLDQVADQESIGKMDSYFRFLNGLHCIIKRVTQYKEKYPVLDSLMADKYRQAPYTKSTSETYKLLKKGCSISEIAAIRNLKTSTIEDHIVEIMVHDPTFPIETFVPAALAEIITVTANKMGVKKLKVIKEHVAEAEYFQIRLVLARLGAEK